MDCADQSHFFARPLLSSIVRGDARMGIIMELKSFEDEELFKSLCYKLIYLEVKKLKIKAS